MSKAKSTIAILEMEIEKHKLKREILMLQMIEPHIKKLGDLRAQEHKAETDWYVAFVEGRGKEALDKLDTELKNISAQMEAERNAIFAKLEQFHTTTVC